jgi:hypothetical protein
MGRRIQVLGAGTADTSPSRRKITIHRGTASKMKTLDPVLLFSYSLGRHSLLLVFYKKQSSISLGASFLFSSFLFQLPPLHLRRQLEPTTFPTPVYAISFHSHPDWGSGMRSLPVLRTGAQDGDGRRVLKDPRSWGWPSFLPLLLSPHYSSILRPE